MVSNFIHTYMCVCVCVCMGMSGSDKGIGPWAAPKDVKELEDKLVLVKVSRLSVRGWELVKTSKRYCSRR